MNCCNAIATWNEEGNTFVLIQVGESPNKGCPFLLVSDGLDASVSCKEALELIIQRHERHLPTEFSPEVERALDSIRPNEWDAPPFRPQIAHPRQ